MSTNPKDTAIHADVNTGNVVQLRLPSDAALPPPVKTGRAKKSPLAAVAAAVPPPAPFNPWATPRAVAQVALLTEEARPVAVAPAPAVVKSRAAIRVATPAPVNAPPAMGVVKPVAPRLIKPAVVQRPVAPVVVAPPAPVAAAPVKRSPVTPLSAGTALGNAAASAVTPTPAVTVRAPTAPAPELTPTVQAPAKRVIGVPFKKVAPLARVEAPAALAVARKPAPILVPIPAPVAAPILPTALPRAAAAVPPTRLKAGPVPAAKRASKSRTSFTPVTRSVADRASEPPLHVATAPVTPTIPISLPPVTKPRANAASFNPEPRANPHYAMPSMVVVEPAPPQFLEARNRASHSMPLQSIRLHIEANRPAHAIVARSAAAAYMGLGALAGIGVTLLLFTALSAMRAPIVIHDSAPLAATPSVLSTSIVAAVAAQNPLPSAVTPADATQASAALSVPVFGRPHVMHATPTPPAAVVTAPLPPTILPDAPRTNPVMTRAPAHAIEKKLARVDIKATHPEVGRPPPLPGKESSSSSTVRDAIAAAAALPKLIVTPRAAPVVFAPATPAAVAAPAAVVVAPVLHPPVVVAVASPVAPPANTPLVPPVPSPVTTLLPTLLPSPAPITAPAPTTPLAGATVLYQAAAAPEPTASVTPVAATAPPVAAAHALVNPIAKPAYRVISVPTSELALVESSVDGHAMVSPYKVGQALPDGKVIVSIDPATGGVQTNKGNLQSE